MPACPSRKIPYRTRARARRAARLRQSDAGHPLHVYRCPHAHCRDYHLTSRKQKGKDR